jgi:hypothetical protein
MKAELRKAKNSARIKSRNAKNDTSIVKLLLKLEGTIVPPVTDTFLFIVNL